MDILHKVILYTPATLLLPPLQMVSFLKVLWFWTQLQILYKALQSSQGKVVIEQKVCQGPWSNITSINNILFFSRYPKWYKWSICWRWTPDTVKNEGFLDQLGSYPNGKVCKNCTLTRHDELLQPKWLTLSGSEVRIVNKRRISSKHLIPLLNSFCQLEFAVV